MYNISHIPIVYVCVCCVCCNKIKGVISHYFCHIIWVSRKSQTQLSSEEGDYDHLKVCLSGYNNFFPDYSL